MAALPYIQLYIADYQADTAHLTLEQKGAYMELIMNYWQTEKPLNNLDDRLASVLKISKRRFQTMKKLLSEFFIIEGDIWTHQRIEYDLEKVLNKSRKASFAASEGARKRANDRLRTLSVRRADAGHIDKDIDKDKDRKHKEKISVIKDDLAKENLEFEVFWKTYPRKVAKAPALKAYLKARQKYSFDEIQLGVVGYLRVCGDDPKFVAHPATWLNQVRFLDPNPQVEVKGAPSQSSNHLGVLGERAHTAINALGQYGVQICAQCEISWPCPKSLENLGGVAR